MAKKAPHSRGTKPRRGRRISADDRRLESALGQTTAKGITVEPFMMTLTDTSQVLRYLHRVGTQFIHVPESQFRYRRGSKTYLISEGDALLFHADVPHGSAELPRTPVRSIPVLCFLGGMAPRRVDRRLQMGLAALRIPGRGAQVHPDAVDSPRRIIMRTHAPVRFAMQRRAKRQDEY